MSKDMSFSVSRDIISDGLKIQKLNRIAPPSPQSCAVLGEAAEAGALTSMSCRTYVLTLKILTANSH
jgi:hypothetical protein